MFVGLPRSRAMVRRVAQGFMAAILLVNATPALASPSNMGPAPGVVEGSAFYDDHYGPVYDGYWTAAGEYFFSTGPGRPYVRDDGHHFSRVMGAGFRPIENLASAGTGTSTAAR